MFRRPIRASLIAIAALMLASMGVHAAPRDASVLFDELHALRSPAYTGGLSRRNRALAGEIRSAVIGQFPAIACPASDSQGGVLFAIEKSPDDQRLPSLAALKPDLARLVKALDDPRQEVRDTAAYAIGLLGPAASTAAPFLRKRFIESTTPNHAKPKGNWHNDALEKMTCEAIIPADFRQVVPDELLPPQEPWPEFLSKAAVLLATLYLDEDIEYPPGMMGYAYSNYAFGDTAGAAVPLLAKILDNPRLSAQKHVEAAQALQALNPTLAMAALPSLLAHANSLDESLRQPVIETLVRLQHEAAIPALVERVKAGRDHYTWETSLCSFGPRAIAAEDTLIDRLKQSDTWPSTIYAAVHVLGCMKSRKALPALIELLNFPDWQAQEHVATAFGEIGDRRAEVVALLERLAGAHWSKIVRQAADASLVELGIRPAPPAAETASPGADVVLVGGGVRPIDHGLPWCDKRARYSFDGQTWFRIKWISPGRKQESWGFAPMGSKFSARATLRVADGQLEGFDAGRYEGFLRHVSSGGKVTEISSGPIIGFYRRGSSILAFGAQPNGGRGGALLDVFRGDDGVWRSKRIASLPSQPKAHGTSPRGELLLSDDLNDYAVIANEIVPLKCDKLNEGDYSRGHVSWRRLLLH